MISINKKIKFTNEVKNENFTAVVGKNLIALNAVQIQYIQRTLHFFTGLVIFISYQDYFYVHLFVWTILFFWIFYETNGQTHTYVQSIIRFIFNYNFNIFSICTSYLLALSSKKNIVINS